MCGDYNFLDLVFACVVGMLFITVPGFIFVMNLQSQIRKRAKREKLVRGWLLEK